MTDTPKAIEATDPRRRCPVCAHPGLDVPPYADYDGTVPPGAAPPYADHLGRPSYEVCRRCGFEFGNDDDPGMGAAPTTFAEYRAEWLAEGAPWFDPPRRGR